MAASGFLLGLKGGFIASIIGLILAVTINFIYYKVKNMDKKYILSTSTLFINRVLFIISNYRRKLR
jgi:hypothetical protein